MASSRRVPSPPRVVALLEHAEQLAAGGRIHEADLLCREAIACDPGCEALLAFVRHLTGTGRSDDAEDVLLAVLDRTGSAADPALRSVAYSNLAAVNREAGRFAEAARWQQRAVAAAAEPREGESPEKTASGFIASKGLDPADLSGLANDALQRHDLDLAERLFRLSLVEEIRRGHLAGQADDLGSLGSVMLLRGEEKQALAHLWRALRLHRRLNDSTGAGRDLLNLAEVCWRAERRRIAFRCWRTAIRLFEGCGASHLAERGRVLLDDAIRIVEVPLRDPLLN